jgi:hypothetical protein
VLTVDTDFLGMELILVTRTELGRLRGIDRRSVKLPPMFARLLAGKRFLPLYLLRDEFRDELLAGIPANAKPKPTPIFAHS